MAISDKRPTCDEVSESKLQDAHAARALMGGCLSFSVSDALQDYELSLKQGKFKPRIRAYRRSLSPLEVTVVSCTTQPAQGEADRAEADLHAKMNAFRLDLLSSKDKARRFLQRAGILDTDGELAEPYRTA